MGKELKEKYERVCAIKDRAIGLIESQLNGNIENVDAKELGEVVDIAKDMAEIMKLSEEACYYHTVTEAMEDSSDEEKKYYMNKYIPEMGMYYTPMGMARAGDSRGRYMYTNPMYMDERFDEGRRDKMYYTSNGGNSNSSSGNSSNYSNGRMNYDDMSMRDYREGRSGMTRKTYMELKESGADKEKTNKELEHYMSELSNDMSEMIQHMDANEKTMLKQKLATLASKIS